MIKTSLPKRVAIVTPWFGKDLLGGAEQQAYQIALRLSQRGHAVTVLTTCCRSFHDDWSTNQLPQGEANEHGIVLRFPVDPRNVAAFEALNKELLSFPVNSIRKAIERFTSSDLDVFTRDNINSSALIEHLSTVHADFDAFIFIPYMFGVIVQGLPVVADRAFLQPCLHDEAYAYLPPIQKLFRLAKRILFNSEGELQLANRIYGPGILLRSTVVGEGVEMPVSTNAGKLPPSLQDSSFVLYLGRRDVTKNVHLLVEAFKRFKAQHPSSNTKLVLAGPGSETWDDPANGLVDLGLVIESDKLALLRSCLALFQPSKNESYSRVMMEAWQHGRPVVVNASCLATSQATEQSEGGWLASTESDWAEMFAKIESMPEEQLNETGRRGATYAAAHGDWDNVIDRYEAVLHQDSPPVTQRNRKLKAIHQLLPDLSFGDAISYQAVLIRDRLRALGYASEIFVKNLDERVQHQAREFSAGSLDPSAGLIYHHSIGTELTTVAIEHSGPKLLIYHNITPAVFFRPYRPGFAWMLETGRTDLRRLSRFFPNSVGDSAFNAAELAGNGFPDPGVLPIAVTPDRWNIQVNNDLLATLSDGKKNILFVGRIAPNKKQDQLLHAFAAFRKLVSDSRLILVGHGKDFDPYRQLINETITRLDLGKHVVMAGQVCESDLMAYYQSADLYWSMSEHEGFCVPIVEAMWFDVPVLAYSAAAVSETLANAGVMFDSRHELSAAAAMASELMVDQSLRQRVIASQRKRRESFLPDVVWARLDELLDRLEA